MVPQDPFSEKYFRSTRLREKTSLSYQLLREKGFIDCDICFCEKEKIYCSMIEKIKCRFLTSFINRSKCDWSEKVTMIKVLSEVKWQEHQKNMKTN